MKILHFSDLHIESSVTAENLSDTRKKIVKSVKDQVSGDSLLILASGDFVDKAKDNFDRAFNFLCGIETDLKVFADKYLGILCCPGNHDRIDTSLEMFNKTYERINHEYCHEYSPKNTVQFVTYETEDVDVILVNSSYNADHKDVQVNLDDFKRALEKSKSSIKIVMLHHPIINSENSNDASLKNAYEFLLLVQEFEIDMVLHSHVHQADCIEVGNFKCPLISVGTLLSEGGKNINNQFNIISLKNNGTKVVENYRYHADQSRRGEKGAFTATTLWKKEVIADNQSISGSSFVEIYDSLYKSIGENRSIMNLSIHYRNQYENLKKEIEIDFAEHLKKAQEWQSEIVPDNLAFNHGERIYGKRLKKGETSAFEYIIQALKNKDYINRAIIPLYTFPEVHDSKDGNLPSFTLVQFGFLDDTKKEFVLTIYLRAWEISKFARINICEAYLICKKVKQKFSSIKNVSLNIFAFRSHIHANFSCFERGAIDRKDGPYRISNFIATHNVVGAISLLKEKKNLRETVISFNGLEALSESVKIAIETEKESSFYPKNLLATIEALILQLREIAGIRVQTSEMEAVEHLYKPLDDAYDAVIASLSKCTGE